MPGTDDSGAADGNGGLPIAGDAQCAGRALELATGVTPSGLALGDVDGDGRLDVVVSNRGSQTISAYLGASDFATKLDTAALEPRDVALGDFNGDGVLDAVVPSESGTVQILLGNGDGTFGPPDSYLTGLAPGAVAVGRADADSYLDVVVANFNSNSISLWHGDGDGTLSMRLDNSVSGVNPNGIAFAEVTGDGITDIIATVQGSSSFNVIPGLGNRLYGAVRSYTTGQYPFDLAVADVDGDGDRDLLAPARGSVALSVSRKNGGMFQAAVNTPSSGRPQAIAVADLDQNGAIDAIIASSEIDKILFYMNDGTGGFVEHPTRLAIPGDPSGLAADDLDGDGFPDVAALSYGQARLKLFLTACGS